MDTTNAEIRENVDINTKAKEINYSFVNNSHVDGLASSSTSNEDVVSPSSSITPPDGGWGWVVVFASFMINLIADGVSLSFGSLFVELVNYFEGSKAKTSWVGSIFFSMPLLAGPIASYLSDRYGCRRVCIAGALLSSAAFIISIFATSLEVLFVTFALAGLGLALCYVTSVVIVAYYFEKRRSLATGISTCGTGVGTFIFSPFTMYLLEEYTLQGTLLILSGFFLNILVFGALMRDLEPNTLSKAAGTTDSVNSTLEESERLYSSLVQLPTYLKEDMPVEILSEISNKEGGYLSSLLHQHPYLVKSVARQSLADVSRSGSKKKSKLKKECSNSDSCEKHLQLQRNSAVDKLGPGYLHSIRVQRDSITYRGAMLNIRRYRLRASSCPNIYRNSITTINDDKTCRCFRDMKALLVDMFDFSIFRNAQYTLFCISNFLLYACVDVPYVYIPDHASKQNINLDTASYLISILGVLNTLGVVIVGYVGDKPYIDSSLLYSVFISISGLMLAIIPWMTDYYGLATVCAVYGFTISANYTLIPIIIVNLISLDSFTGAYGLLLLAQGIASLIGPPAAGALFDITGEYNVTFFCTGIIIFISGVMVAILPAGKLFAVKRTSSTTEKNSVIGRQQKELLGLEGFENADSILLKNHSKTCKSYYPEEITEEPTPFMSISNNNVKDETDIVGVEACRNNKVSLYENPLSNI